MLIGDRLGHYEVLGKLGEGGMGEVYRARDTKLNRDVAIKILPADVANDPERLVRFQREAQVLASLNHPNIAHIHGLEESGDVLALVMELVEGEDLSQRLERGAVPLDEALPIAKQIAEALEAAHEQGIIHRDLKPANIKVRPDGTVKVLDFGLAKAIEGAGGVGAAGRAGADNLTQSPTITTPAMTQAGMILGTAAYMAPEQAKGRPVDRRADIWAFGVVLFEMLSGQRPFTGETISDTLASVLKTDPEWTVVPADTPAAIRRLLRRCLERDPKQRLQAIGEARIALSEPGGESLPEVQTHVRSRLTLLPWILVGALLVTTVAVSLIHVRETETPSQSIRFQFSGPETSALSMFQLSPDGLRVVFATNNASETRLWVRPLDSVNATPLAGTDGATYPFWSQDSTRIGFFAQGRLKTIAASGGLAVPVCLAANGRGGTWNRNGTILFTPDAFGGLYRVAEVGGVPVAVTSPGEGPTDSDRFPEFLPDGIHFLFTRQSSQDAGIFAGSLSDHSITRLLADNSNAQFVPATGQKGFLLFRRADALTAQPFDAEHLTTSGGGVPLVEHVINDSNSGHGAFASSASGTLAYVSGIRGGNRQLFWLDRSGKRTVVSQSAEINSFALSPDDKVVVLGFGTPNEGAADLWLQQIDAGSPSKRTFGPARNVFPVWSPDGRDIAFEVSGDTDFQIARLRASDSGIPEVLLKGGLSSANVYDWSRNGQIVFSSRSPQTKDDLWLLPTEGDRKAALYLQTAGNDREGHFSPDGEWMAYQSDVSGRNEIYVEHVPANGSKTMISSAGGVYPHWSRDGKELFYVETGHTLISVAVTLGTTFHRGQRHVLLEDVPFYVRSNNGSAFQPSENGERFLALLQTGAEPPITVLTNWQGTLPK